MSKDTNSKLRCSFCFKTQENVEKLVAGPDVYICNECVNLCLEVIEEENAMNSKVKEEVNNLKPLEIKGILDQYIIGQDEVKKVISVAVYNHYKRIKSNPEKDDIELTKSNVLLLGPTGSGKTLIAQTVARILNVPFAIADATTLTEAGYVGEDVENILLKLIQSADYDVEKAEKGIIYIDEIDKITRKSENSSITRDVSGEGVQQALLKIIEGTVASVPPQGGRKHPNQDLIQINTKDILFICGGAFDGLEKVVRERSGKNTIGFENKKIQNEKEYTEDEKVSPDDIVKFGIIPEFIGRLPIITNLEPLDKEALIKILTEPKNSIIKQYKKLFELDGVVLEFEQKALEKIAEKALKRKTGARGLRSIIENMLLELMFDIPSMGINSVLITETYVETGVLKDLKIDDNITNEKLKKEVETIKE